MFLAGPEGPGLRISDAPTGLGPGATRAPALARSLWAVLGMAHGALTWTGPLSSRLEPSGRS